MAAHMNSVNSFMCESTKTTALPFRLIAVQRVCSRYIPVVVKPGSTVENFFRFAVYSPTRIASMRAPKFNEENRGDYKAV
jgi:hypothetical protein